MEKLMKQVVASQGDRRITTWVDRYKEITVGSVVTLKGADGKWRIEEIFSNEVDEKHLNGQRSFDNNNYDKHDGLFK